MKFLVVNNGLGELAISLSFANFLRTKSHEIKFFVGQNEKKVLSSTTISYEVVGDNAILQNKVDQYSPDVLILSNSKTTYRWFKTRPHAPKLIISIDANWLFSFTGEHRVHSWIDLYSVTFPREIFNLGLKEYGGHYSILPEIKEKIIAPGFIPTSKKLNRFEKTRYRKILGVNSDKVIVGYFGRFVTYREFLLERVLRAVEKIDNSERIKFIFIGEKPKKDYLRKSWFNWKQWLSNEDFENTIGAADLLISHHGMGTISKAVRNSVPVLSFIPKPIANKQVTSEFLEIEPFVKLDLVKHAYYDDLMEKISKSISDLLFNQSTIRQIRVNQKKIFRPGERILYQKILKILNA